MRELAKLLKQDLEEDEVGEIVGWFPVGRLPLPSGSLWVGDPGFSWAELDGGDGVRVALESGDYEVSAQVARCGDAHVVATLRVQRSNATDPARGEQIAEAGTDSATIGVADAEQLLAAFRTRFGHDGNAAALFLEDHEGGRVGTIQPAGESGASLFYVNSGMGDGTGPVYGLYDGGRLVGVELPFLES